jgi:hypothetical protein
MGSNWDGDNEYDTFPMASTTRRWTSSNEGRSCAVIVPSMGALLDVISKMRKARHRSGTIPSEWY